MVSSGSSPDQVIEKKGLRQVTDPGAIAEVVPNLEGHVGSQRGPPVVHGQHHTFDF